MKPVLSRRVALVMMYEPILSMTGADAHELPYAVERATDFSDLPESFQTLILAAEETRERALVELRREGATETPHRTEAHSKGRRDRRVS